MKTSFLRILVVTLGAAISLTIISAFAADYLIIKKRDGTTQKVPLNFPAGQIEEFDVESVPDAEAPRVRQPVTPERRPSVREPEEPEERVEREQRPVTTPQQLISPRGPGRGPAGPTRTEVPAEPSRKPLEGISLAPLPGGKGVFTVNVYKLPDEVRALPDFSAFRPQQVLMSDKITLDPARGDEEPAGLGQDTTGLGLRCVG
ncbi:MAG: hypothetical protein FJY85_24050, partial [Deltaproteobacteria bacterium]|nr:hypothetical protein [Deltaproteobacteria bacterium]